MTIDECSQQKRQKKKHATQSTTFLYIFIPLSLAPPLKSLAYGAYSTTSHTEINTAALLPAVPSDRPVRTDLPLAGTCRGDDSSSYGICLNVSFRRSLAAT